MNKRPEITQNPDSKEKQRHQCSTWHCYKCVWGRRCSKAGKAASKPAEALAAAAVSTVRTGCRLPKAPQTTTQLLHPHPVCGDYTKRFQSSGAGAMHKHTSQATRKTPLLLHNLAACVVHALVCAHKASAPHAHKMLHILLFESFVSAQSQRKRAV